jgi:hypothetical protein
VLFQPASEGSKAATITISDDAGDLANATQSITLTGLGKTTLQPPTPSLTPPQLDFASQEINSASPAQTVTLTNMSATDPLNIADISLAGGNAAEFSMDTTAPNTCAAQVAVAAGASCEIHLIFQPTATGARAASLSIATDATGSPHAVALAGTGSSAPAPVPAPAPASNKGGGGCVAAGGPGDFTLLLLMLFVGVACFKRRVDESRASRALD